MSIDDATSENAYTQSDSALTSTQKPTPDEVRTVLDRAIEEKRIELPLMKQASTDEKGIELEKQCIVACTIALLYGPNNASPYDGKATAGDIKYQLLPQLASYYKANNQGRYILEQQEHILTGIARDFAMKELGATFMPQPRLNERLVDNGTAITFLRS